MLNSKSYINKEVQLSHQSLLMFYRRFDFDATLFLLCEANLHKLVNMKNATKLHAHTSDLIRSPFLRWTSLLWLLRGGLA